MNREGSKSKEFLDSIARNSRASQKAYASGLLAFHKFLGGTADSLDRIVESLQKGELDVYRVLNNFVSYLFNSRNQLGQALAMQTTGSYMVAVRSYLQFYDIDVVPAKFKRKVKMPKLYHEDEEALDAQEIRTVILSCRNRRLVPFLLVLASGGLRATEACAIRLCDIEFANGGPTKIHVRKEYAKTRVARDIYISDEATKSLQDWIDWKYRKRKWDAPLIQRTKKPTDLVFTHHQSISDARVLYPKIRSEFVRVLNTAGYEKRKDGMLRRTITLHSFRRHVKTVISDQVSKDYSEWFLGHSKSPYYTMKEPMRREIYATKCMKYLTFLDYSILEASGKSIEKKLTQAQTQLGQSEKEIESLKQEVSRLKSKDNDLIKELADRLDYLESKLGTRD